MNSFTIKKKFIDFLKSKGHREIPNTSLIPENDPTILFTTAGMHPLVPYLLGEKHPLGTRVTNVQRCVRTDDIEEVGDTIHLTFFEMLGNWSLGDYFKEEAIQIAFEFLTKEIMLDPERIYVTVFEGDKDAPLDSEATEIWKKTFKKVGIEAEVFDKKKRDNDKARIFPLNKKENWWGPAGQTGPCGPDSEMFYWRGKGKPDFEEFVPWDDSNMFIELGNDVFMAYNKNEKGEYKPLKQKNVDFGGGLERITLVKAFQEKDGSVPLEYTIFNTDLFDTPLAYLRSLVEDESRESTKEENEEAKRITEFDITLTDLKNSDQAVKSFRVVLDHMRAATFIAADGIEPSNKDQGYILRRLIRRAIRHAKLIGIEQNFTKDLAKLYIEKYKVQYPHLQDNGEKILNSLEKEEVNFEKTIQRGVTEMDKLQGTGQKINGADLFNLYETHGYPIEMALDELQITNYKLRGKYQKEFDAAKEKHQKKSREGAKGKFAGGLADNSEITTRYHTATHLLLKSLQEVLGRNVHQRGSNITAERLRFDFSHSEQLTDKQITEVENKVNEKIKAGLKVTKKVMPKEEALKTGAECEFPEKYPDKVSVYEIEGFSKEFCGGPHVNNTKELAKSGKFKIIKEESVGSGVRRIKAVLKKE